MGLPRYDKLPEPMPEGQRLREAPDQRDWEVIVIGGGFAGLSAAIYLGRAMRRVLVIDGEESLGCWEPEVQNYFGFPEGIGGGELLRRGREQAKKFGAEVLVDEVEGAHVEEAGEIVVRGRHVEFRAQRILIATGLYHLPPQIPGVNECVGHSFFFCKDCDGYKVRDQAVAVVARNNEAVDYALGLTLFSPMVVIATNGEAPTWDARHAEWIREYEIPVYTARIRKIEHESGRCVALHFEDGTAAKLDYVFTTRGDIYYNEIAKQLGVKLDAQGQIMVNRCQETSVRNVYAAGCVTEANCQMIIAAGDGAIAAQAINRSLFEESLANHSLKRRRAEQIRTEATEPEVVGKSE